MAKCKYSVVKYVPDHIRDEPRNIGILVQSLDGKSTNSKFITNFNKINTSEPLSFLQEIVKNLEHKNSQKIPLDKLEEKYSYKIRLSPPRSILVGDMHKDTGMLFDKFISIKEVDSRNNVRLNGKLGDYIWNHIQSSKKDARRGISVKGKTSAFEFSFSYKDTLPRFLHLIPFHHVQALNAAKLFDWAVSDILENKEFERSSFRPLIIKPSRDNSRYDALDKRYRESLGILESKKYDLKCIDEGEPWEKEIKAFV